MTSEKWGSKPYAYQILNIASEMNRARRWIKENEKEYLHHSLERALELIDLTVSSNQGTRPLRELLRLRETLASYYVGSAYEYDRFVKLLRSLTKLDEDVQRLGLKFSD